MRSYVWEGTATATSSISHGGDVLGTTTYLRREAFLTPDGRIDVPVLSGNGVRGILRDHGAMLLWNQLGCPRLPVPVMHALWSGGALVKAKTTPLSGQRLADLRRMVAHLGVFGAAGGGRIIDGVLTVGKLVPICAQTAHLLPDHLREPSSGATLPDLWDLLQIERYSRVPNAARYPDVLTVPEPADRADPVAGAPDPGDGVDDPLMRYGNETFIAGTRFHVRFGLRFATGDEHDFFTDVLAAFTAAGTVGGRTSRGHGHVRFDLTGTCDGDPEPGDWRALGGASPTQVVEALGWLD